MNILPETKQDWQSAVVKAKISHLNIHTYELKLNSASKLTFEQYLLLRNLRLKGRRSTFNPVQQNEDDDSSVIVSPIAKRTHIDPDSDSDADFDPKPKGKPKQKPKQDEQEPDQNSEEMEPPSEQARTDGYLEDKATGKVRALIEVKPYIRDKGREQTRMQEAAQMVGWIANSNQSTEPLLGRYFHISQDRTEIYISFAEYDNNYVEYLRKGDTQGQATFMTLHEFGPRNTLNSRDMKELGQTILALTLRAHADQQVEYGL
ncbi:hypothetical protein B7463_g9816, partial [Scytalidium lignicola]